MESMGSSREKRVVPLSYELLRDIMTHGNEYQTPAGSHEEAEQVGDTRPAGRSGATSSSQSLPQDAMRRTGGFADGPIVENPPVMLAFLPRLKTKKPKRKPIVKNQKEMAKDSMVELWARDAAKKRVFQKVLRSLSPDHASLEKAPPSVVLTRIEARLDYLEHEVHELQKLLPIPMSSDPSGAHGLSRSQSTLSLGPRSTYDLRRTKSSNGLHLQDEQPPDERNINRNLYCDMQMHLVNMIVVPKSRTSLFLNQQKELSSQLGGHLGHWRHQYSDEDRMRDREAADFLNGNSKNVRRQ